jgi:DNA repair exonuclease SbcCD ATPase subunit
MTNTSTPNEMIENCIKGTFLSKDRQTEEQNLRQMNEEIKTNLDLNVDQNSIQERAQVLEEKIDDNETSHSNSNPIRDSIVCSTNHLNDGKNQLEFDSLLIDLMDKFLVCFKVFDQSLVWRMVSMEITKNGFKELTASTRKTSFKVLNERYFQVLKISIDSQTACQIFALFPKLNIILIDDSSLYCSKSIFKECFYKSSAINVIIM